MRFDDCIGCLVESVLSKSCIAVLSDRDIKPFKFVAARLRDVCVQGLFFSLSDSSTSSGLFFNFVPIWIVSFDRTRSAFALAASCLRFTAFVSFWAFLACCVACLSAFSRANSSRAAWRAKSRAILFSSVSRAFSSLAIALCSFLSITICLRCCSACFSSATLARTRAIFAGLKNSAWPSFSPGSYRFIAFPRFLFFFSWIIVFFKPWIWCRAMRCPWPAQT